MVLCPNRQRPCHTPQVLPPLGLHPSAVQLPFLEHRYPRARGRQQLCKENSLARHMPLLLLEPVPEQEANRETTRAMAPPS